jgi:hypothetical protein
MINSYIVVLKYAKLPGNGYQNDQTLLAKTGLMLQGDMEISNDSPQAISL